MHNIVRAQRRAGNAAASAFLSETFVDAGVHFVAVDFNNVTETTAT
jgi:hypothetical protein